MRPTHLGRVVVGFLLVSQFAAAQVSIFPYFERFDSVSDSTLPTCWEATKNRRSGGDFFASASSPRSSPHCVYSQNSLIAQALTSPVFDFANRTPDKLQFALARSSTHRSGVLLLASVDGGLTFAINLSDTLRNPGTSGYSLVTLQLPSSLANQSNVRIRWQVLGDSGSSTGTLRIDDIAITTAVSVDLAVKNIATTRPFTASQDSLVIKATVINYGTQPIVGYDVHFFCDLDNDSIPDPAERFTTVGGPPLASSDSTVLTAIHPGLWGGSYLFFVIVAVSGDELPSNDTSSAIVTVGYRKGSLLINEFMFDPLPGQNEWIELYNRSVQPVDLRCWTLMDRPTATGSVNAFMIASATTVVRPGGYAVVAADSSLFALFPGLSQIATNPTVLVLGTAGGLGLNSEGDDIILKDLTGTLIDSVSYSSRWHRPDVTDTKGRSLERVNPDLDSNLPENWTTSVLPEGGTPGKPNSALTRSPINGSNLSFSPNPFSPDGDGYEDFCLIQYNIPFVSATLHVKIYDVKGRLVRTLANSLVSNSHGDILWDGLNDERQRVRIGVYIVFLQATNVQGNASTAFKGVVVVASKL